MMTDIEQLTDIRARHPDWMERAEHAAMMRRMEERVTGVTVRGGRITANGATLRAVVVAWVRWVMGGAR